MWYETIETRFAMIDLRVNALQEMKLKARNDRHEIKRNDRTIRRQAATYTPKGSG